MTKTDRCEQEFMSVCFFCGFMIFYRFYHCYLAEKYVYLQVMKEESYIKKLYNEKIKQ